MLHERLQQSAEAEQAEPAATQAQRPLEVLQSIRPQHSLLLVQLTLASLQQSEVVGDGR